MRMFGPQGNPNARNLFEIVDYLQQHAGVRFKLRPESVRSEADRKRRKSG
jgi:hypothetical protein